MGSERRTPRYLGAAFLFVFIVSVLTQVPAAAGPQRTISEILASASQNVPLLRLSVLGELANSLGILVLAALLYVVLHKQNKTVALAALGWWWAEAVMLAVSKIGTYALIPLSREFVAAGAPQLAVHSLNHLSSLVTICRRVAIGRECVGRWGRDLKNHVSPVQVRLSAQRTFAGFSGVR